MILLAPSYNTQKKISGGQFPNLRRSCQNNMNIYNLEKEVPEVFAIGKKEAVYLYGS